jgi:hypothetical protein
MKPEGLLLKAEREYIEKNKSPLREDYHYV